MTIEQVIQGSKEGNRKCQDALVQKTAPALMAICMRYINDYSLAQDALQEAYINAFKYLHTYKFEGPFEGWLRKIAVRTSIQIVKSRKQMVMDVVENVDFDMRTQIPEAYQKIDCEELLGLINTLPPSLSAVFNLSVVDGYQHGEIAEMLGITESTSRSALAKARQKLVERLNQKEQKLFQWAAAL